MLCSMRIERNSRCYRQQRLRFPSETLLLWMFFSVFPLRSARCNPTTPRHRWIRLRVSLLLSLFLKTLFKRFLESCLLHRLRRYPAPQTDGPKAAVKTSIQVISANPIYFKYTSIFIIQKSARRLQRLRANFV